MKERVQLANFDSSLGIGGRIEVDLVLQWLAISFEKSWVDVILLYCARKLAVKLQLGEINLFLH